MDEEERRILVSNRASMKEAYSNLLKWRHAFAHEGKKLSTLEEVTAAMPLAKRIIVLLDQTMST
jgi:hypothetical protein